MAKKKKTTKKKAAKKKTTKKAAKKKTTKKTAKKKVAKKKATKKKAKKKTMKKKAVKKKTKKKATKKKATKKKATKKKTTTKKKAKKKATKKKATKKAVKKKTTKAKATTKKAAAPKKKAAPKKAAKPTKKKAAKPAPKKSDSKPAKNLTVYTAQVTVGGTMPQFDLPLTGNKNLTNEQLKGQKTVIYFYPKDHTPGCTIEGHDFSKLKNDFSDNNTVVYGVSRDSIKSHERFIEKQNYTIELISDEDEKLCSIFGAIKLKNMYGKQVRGIDRSTFVIDENGQLVKEWRSVKVAGHAEEVLEYIKNS